jgi:uncharacterized protein YbaP (TraB family)
MIEMKRKIRGLLAGLLTVGMALCTSFAAAQNAASAPAKAPRKFLLWKASSPTATVYLMGSIHVGDASMYPLPAAVESAFESSKVLAVEINVKNIDQSKAVKLVQEFGLYSGDDTLSNHVSKETAATLNLFCEKAGFPKAAFEKVKPWVAAVTVIAISLKAAGEDPALGIDQHFLDEAKTQRIEEMESAEYQLALFSGASEQDQLELLTVSLSQVDKTQEFIQKMQSAYLSGDAGKLLAVVNEQDTLPKALRKKLIDDRNLAMADKVEGYLKGSEQVFVVVGAAHVVGDTGIVKLLKNKGYKVEQVSAEAK